MLTLQCRLRHEHEYDEPDARLVAGCHLGGAGDLVYDFGLHTVVVDAQATIQAGNTHTHSVGLLLLYLDSNIYLAGKSN